MKNEPTFEQKLDTCLTLQKQQDRQIKQLLQSVKDFENDYEKDLEQAHFNLQNLSNDIANVQGILSTLLQDIQFEFTDNPNVWSAIQKIKSE